MARAFRKDDYMTGDFSDQLRGGMDVFDAEDEPKKKWHPTCLRTVSTAQLQAKVATLHVAYSEV